VKSVKIVPNINSKALAMCILYDCVLPHAQDFRPRLCPAALEKTQSENWEEFFIIPYHHDVTGSFGSFVCPPGWLAISVLHLPSSPERLMSSSWLTKNLATILPSVTDTYIH